MRVDELDFELPEELIGSEPMEPRDAARLLVVPALRDFSVADLPSLLPPSLLVVNDTRVLAARVFGAKTSGGKVELLLVERLALEAGSERWLCLSKSSKPLAVDSVITLEEDVRATVLARRDEGFVELRLDTDVYAWLDRIGTMPLPPYIARPVEARDRERYQTVYASEPGAVAAPTAGLHFTTELFERLRAAGHHIASITLHVGPGTFRPVKVDDLDDHAMHEERYAIPEATVLAIRAARAEGRPVVAIGTTVVRALESAAEGAEDGVPREGEGRTRILLQPGSRFRVVDGLFTNFHLPRSTLLALVMAFAGIEPIREAYRTAVGRRYRFYSYGDAMLIPPNDAPRARA
jgi:S-adenosylmethionine:tRNA ribosyltransferase-isomerase